MPQLHSLSVFDFKRFPSCDLWHNILHKYTHGGIYRTYLPYLCNYSGSCKHPFSNIHKKFGWLRIGSDFGRHIDQYILNLSLKGLLAQINVWVHTVKILGQSDYNHSYYFGCYCSYCGLYCDPPTVHYNGFIIDTGKL